MALSKVVGYLNYLQLKPNNVTTVDICTMSRVVQELFALARGYFHVPTVVKF